MNNTSEQVINRKYTFWQLMNEYRVEIPIIQRDYAQGRSNDNAEAIREELLNSIYGALLNNKSLNFDFVYGTIEGDKLLPLDGQQRLTTFFLLHWYLAQKEGKMDVAKTTLARFSYTTRISSRDFCNVLMDVKFDVKSGKSVSSFIKNENRYFKTWDNDPTIKHMLNMLDDIHQKFQNANPLFDLLISENAPLTFNFLPMEHYALTDDLYIKMNARGKTLTVFENFKAKFIQHLKAKNLSCNHFEKCIDGKWTDLLWDYRDKSNTIDNQFMNLFCFITEMLFLEKEAPREGDSPFKPNKIRDLIDFYQSEEDVQKLYQYLDLWTKKDEATELLSAVFSISREEDKVRLFEGKVDLFSAIINGEFVSLANKLLLFAVMKRLNELGKDTDTQELKDYVRIVRNYLLNTRSFVRKKGAFTSDLRFGRFAIPIMQHFINVFSDKNNVYEILLNTEFDKNLNGDIISHEKEKAKLILDRPELKPIILGLEDIDCFRSSIFNILAYVCNYAKEDTVSNLEDLFMSKDEKIRITTIQAMLSVKDFGIRIGGSVFGDRYFYGNIDNFYSILTFVGDDAYKEFLNEFLKQYEELKTSDIEESLFEVILNNMSKVTNTDWRYPLIHFDNTLKSNDQISSRNIVLAKEECEDGSILLHKINGLMLMGYHAVPEYMEVYSRWPGVCVDRYIGYAGRDGGYIHLSFSEGLKIGFDHSGKLKAYYEDIPENRWIDKAVEEYERIDTSHLNRVEMCMAYITLIESKAKQ